MRKLEEICDDIRALVADMQHVALHKSWHIGKKLSLLTDTGKYGDGALGKALDLLESQGVSLQKSSAYRCIGLSDAYELADLKQFEERHLSAEAVILISAVRDENVRRKVEDAVLAEGGPRTVKDVQALLSSYKTGIGTASKEKAVDKTPATVDAAVCKATAGIDRASKKLIETSEKSLNELQLVLTTPVGKGKKAHAPDISDDSVRTLLRSEQAAYRAAEEVQSRAARAASSPACFASPQKLLMQARGMHEAVRSLLDSFCGRLVVSHEAFQEAFSLQHSQCSPEELAELGEILQKLRRSCDELAKQASETSEHIAQNLED